MNEISPSRMAADSFSAEQLNVLDILFDRMPMGICVLDRDLRLMRVNPTWVEFVAKYTETPASAVKPGMPFFSIIPGGENSLRPYMEAALRGEIVRREGVRVESSGIVSYWDMVYSPLMRNGEIVGVVDVSTDATEQVLAYYTLERRVEERTREIERRRRVAEGLRDILNILNSQRPLAEILDHIMEQACSLLGTDTGAIYRLEPRRNTLTIQVWRGLSDEYVSRVSVPVGEGVVGRAVKNRSPIVIVDMLEFLSETGILHKHEAYREDLMRFNQTYSAILAVPLIVRNEVYGGITLYYPRPRLFTAEDVDLARAFGDQAALALENARLSSQAQEAAVAAERSRLARDLHDSVTQTLFSASLIAEVLPRIWDRNADEGRRRLEELRQLARGALAEMRTLLLELRPAALVEAELPDLLRQVTEAVAGRVRLPVSLQVLGSEKDRRALPPDVQIVFYRIVQEALNNVARHAHAEKAEVRVQYTENSVELQVWDDGQGFEPDRVQPEHLGLGIMRERAEAVGANLTVTSVIGQGTTVSLLWVRPDHF